MRGRVGHRIITQVDEKQEDWVKKTAKGIAVWGKITIFVAKHGAGHVAP